MNYTNVQIQEIMNTEVISIKPTDSMARAKEVLTLHGFHHLPVVDPSTTQILGMISSRECDLLTDRYTIFGNDRDEIKNSAFLESILVKEVMSSPAVMLKATDSVQLAADIFCGNILHALGIVDESKKIVGIITSHDLIQYAFAEKIQKAS